MSQIEAVITAIAGISVTADSITPTVYYGSTLKQGGDNVPMRVILPSDVDSDSKGVQFVTVGLGRVMVVRWNISDLFLLASFREGSGLDQYANTLIRYASAYVDALQSKQALITNSTNTTIEGVSLNIGGYQFPVGSGAWYFGVEVRYQVKEIVS